MIHPSLPFRILALLAGLLLTGMSASAARVRIGSVEASFAEKPEELRHVIDGKDTGREGWSAWPRTSESHSLIVRTAEPLYAIAYDITLCFLSGYPGRYFGRFAVSYTTDPQPSLTGKWQRITPQGVAAVGTTMEARNDGMLVTGGSDSMIGDAVLLVRVRSSQQAITGFRLDVFPFERPDIPEPRLSWSEYRDFRLTELRIDANTIATTNIALGSPVKASHPLWAGMSAGVLTDGLPGSFNHPAQPDFGSAFHFEIDLGGVHPIDHIALRGRADGHALDRMSRVLVQLYDEPPDSDAEPAWHAMSRADGSRHTPGEIDILRAADGKGISKGRYLRLSSDSRAPLSPQIAEVEVYETLTPRLVEIRADGNHLPLDDSLRIPPGTSLISMALKIPGVGLPERMPIRWRFRGLHDDWQLTREPDIEVVQPRAGTYTFEAQVRHTDGEWDSSVYSLPITISPVFWKTPVFYASVAAALLAGLTLLARAIIRKRQARELAALQLQTALAEERSRIARDMHDEVGARLSQIALMQDLFLWQHPLPEEAQRGLRQLAQNTRHAVDALDQVVWAVNPLHDTLAGVAEYLSHTATSYLTPLNISCRLDAPFDWPDIVVRAQVRHQLVLAFREALQNVAKHAGATSVTLTMRYEAPELFVRLTDDGRGLPDDPDGEGKDGLTNMQSRLTTIGGACIVRRADERGTEVQMRAPLTTQLN